MTALVWAGLGLGFLISLVSPYFLRPLLTHFGLVDVPNERSSHTTPTVRGGGFGPLLGIVAGGTVVSFGFTNTESRILFIIIICAALLIGTVGALEDAFGLTIAARALSQFVLGLIVSVVLGIIFESPAWLIALAVLFFAAYVNFANFMDGLNGISGLHGVVVGAAFAVIGVLQGQPWLVATGLLMALAFGSFLPWNLIPPGTFLGDVGSYLLGGSIAVTVIAAQLSGTPMLTVLAPISIYLADTVSVVFRRASRKEAILRAHRTHAYQRLTDTGLSHVQASTLVASLSALNALFGILVLQGALNFWIAMLCISLVCVFYLALPKMRGSTLAPRPVFTIGEIEMPEKISAREDFRPQKFAVLGSTGFVGSAMVEFLQKQGYEVVELRGPRVDLSPLVESPREVALSAKTHPATDELAELLVGVDVVINAAGLATPDEGPSNELYGANSLLPAIVAWSSERSGIKRVVHLSSAAVQGRKQTLDETLDATPFSPYSRSKALGERAFLCSGFQQDLDLVVVRATSVQGPGRATTESFRWIAQSNLASVARPGSQATVVSSINGLVDFVGNVAVSNGALAPVMLQPWEGLSAADVIRFAGSKEPLMLPRTLCLSLLFVARTIGLVIPEIAGAGRRLELMWVGQKQESAFSEIFPPIPSRELEEILQGSGKIQRSWWRKSA